MSKINVKTFAAKHSLNVCPLVFKNKNYTAIAGWKEMNLLESHNLKIKNTGGYMVSLKGPHNNFCILDTDDEESYNFVLDLLEKHNLKRVDTPSYTGHTKNISFMRHFWFKLPKIDYELKNQCSSYIKKLDFLVDHIAEYKDNEVEEDLDELPEEIINLFCQPEKVDDAKSENNDNIEVSEQKITELLALLKPTRGNEFQEWLVIGSSLKSIDVDFDIVFDNFCKTRKGYQGSKDIKKKWADFPDNNNIGTLINMAKQDNPDKLKLWVKKWNVKTNDDEEYNKLKEEFEKIHFKIMEPLTYCKINKYNELVRTGKSEFTDKYENMLLMKNDKEVSFIKQWMKDPKIRTYDYIDFLPCQEAPENVFNTFTGFYVESAPKNIIGDFEQSKIMEHIKNLCNNDEKVVEYFLNFLACRVKCPHKLTNTALIIRGEQGTGKDTFFDWFGRQILGEKYYYSDDKIDNIFGHFNGMIENKILIVLNETNGKDSSEYIESIKNGVTRTTNIINPKGDKQFKNTNNIGYVLLTNNKNPIKIAPDDRRFCAIEMNSNIKNNEAYFYALRAEMESKKYDYEFYQFLLNRNIEKYNFTNNRPITSFYNNMKELNIPVMIKFLEDVYYNNNQKYKSREFKGYELFDAFTTYVKNNNFKTEYNITKFGVELKAFSFIVKKRNKDGIIYVININEINNYLIANGFVEHFTD